MDEGVHPDGRTIVGSAQLDWSVVRVHGLPHRTHAGAEGQCHQVACLAWIEEKSEGEVHFGWPPVQFSGQAEALSDAMKILHEKASEADAAGM